MPILRILGLLSPHLRKSYLGGIQLLCLSILGSYLAHIYEEVKHRPPYVVRDILNDPRERKNHASHMQLLSTRTGEQDENGNQAAIAQEQWEHARY